MPSRIHRMIVAGIALAWLAAGSCCVAQEDAPVYLPLNEPGWYAEKMAQPAELKYDDAPLAEVVQEISERYGVPVRLDIEALDNVGLASDVPVTCHVSGVSLASALATLLHEYDLAWNVSDDSLVITTPQEAENHLVVRLYLVRDLVTPDGAENAYGEGDYEGLAEVIVGSCSPNTWGSGNTYLPYHEESGTMVIEQTLEVHREVEELLAGLRSARRLAREQQDGNLESEALVLAVYRLAPPAGVADVTPWGDEMAAAIEAMIEPASWQAGGGMGRIRAVGGVLFIRQTPAVQAKLRCILKSRVVPRRSSTPVYPRCTPLAPVRG